jgi:protein tyrosine/serine phosphatase
MKLIQRLAGCAVVALCGAAWINQAPKRVAEIEPGQIYRGAWQSPEVLRGFVQRAGIRTVVTLTAINTDDPKYTTQKRVLNELSVNWVIIPMRGSTATLDQLVEASDLIAEPKNQPVFFHCVGGHHRSNLVHAAYRIRHHGWTASDAWAEVSALPWTRPEQDQDDRSLIRAFAAHTGDPVTPTNSNRGIAR